MLRKKLIIVRKEKRFSQHDMAMHLNISQSQYLRKEKGKIGIRNEEWERIAKLLNVNVCDIKETNNKISTNQILNEVMDIKINDFRSSNACYNIPEYLLENQQKYIEFLKLEIQLLKGRIVELEKKICE